MKWLVVVALAAFTLGAGLAHAQEKTGEIVGSIVAPVPKHRANAIVHVKNAGSGTSTAKVKMDQKGLIFVPRVLPIQKGTTVEFTNSDPTGHNVFTPDGDKYDLGTWPKGDSRKYTFTKAGVFRQLCRVHDDMIAFIVVLDTKYFAVSDKNGQFKLSGLPPGDYTLSTWHEKLGASDVTVKVTAGQAAKVDITLGAKK
ncbi:MAG: carboxypeptidase regulatory-like domain-containing protein [Deltaproteobacteria bacterium]|nr:carboxypeptidase regulatory-like domain-containing protein [Deltaproteobacteria bacterium]